MRVPPYILAVFRTWKHVIVCVVLLCAFAYSTFVLISSLMQPVNDPNEIRAKVTLQALLFRKGTDQDVYATHTFRTGLVYSRKILQSSNEYSTELRLVSPRATLIGSGNQAHVQDMGSPYNYKLLTDEENSPLVYLSRDTNFVYFLTDEEDHPHLHVRYSECGEIENISLPAREEWYSPEQLFERLGIPMQHTIVLSPTEMSLALLSHNTLSRITLIDTLSWDSRTLSAPSFDSEQLHFSPFFIDNQTLLFSVLDRNHWGTVRYHLRTGAYEILSSNFTDHAYHTLSGKIILQQSFFNGETNIPFGSIALLKQKQGFPVQTIEAMTGPREQNTRIFAFLFEDPDAAFLHFRRVIKVESFNAIEQTGIREALRSFWYENQLHPMQSGDFHLLQLNPDSTLTPIETIPFEIRPPAISAQYRENVEPLLRVLELSAPLIEKYRERKEIAEQNGEQYLLLDDLSY
ncbi:hypothetical protein AUJ46_01135 [Candidatus Peregrinibacteria bacterium CG1_02_54_53]|nr:MAG: hypothetical protein AUJ46_01135 [Candidatus Peregrinibacteria bacterium CG1_02_54_53]